MVGKNCYETSLSFVKQRLDRLKKHTVVFLNFCVELDVFVF